MIEAKFVTIVAIASKPKSEVGKSRAKIVTLTNEMATRPACETATHWTLEMAEPDLDDEGVNVHVSLSSHAIADGVIAELPALRVWGIKSKRRAA